MNARDSNWDPAGRDELLAGLAEIRLLTVDGADFRRVGVEAVDGEITLSGVVETHSEREQAAAVVRRVEGVCAVNNQLQVAHEVSGRSTAYVQRRQIQAAIGPDPTFDEVETSVQILENGSSGLISKARGVQ